eukprot:CAMPEP_0198555984 /NCGR_PEP_ID=MMETSP1462-20131121/85858_1 /TAXON_ID=1333877 /ORGANISM="Brandtodinium nutriculum, Strain RCC3387" /LENGTH=83 /DNA_ID=CAMNT_0044286719 /DNA_START=22 /DNA_END=269 /DNA_ORIENTATION=-
MALEAPLAHTKFMGLRNEANNGDSNTTLLAIGTSATRPNTSPSDMIIPATVVSWPHISFQYRAIKAKFCPIGNAVMKYDKTMV